MSQNVQIATTCHYHIYGRAGSGQERFRSGWGKQIPHTFTDDITNPIRQNANKLLDLVKKMDNEIAAKKSKNQKLQAEKQNLLYKQKRLKMRRQSFIQKQMPHRKKCMPCKKSPRIDAFQFKIQKQKMRSLGGRKKMYLGMQLANV